MFLFTSGSFLFLWLKIFAKLRTHVSRSELDFVIHAFISSCLHYSNSVFIFVNKAALERLQVVQNADVFTCHTNFTSSPLTSEFTLILWFWILEPCIETHLHTPVNFYIPDHMTSGTSWRQSQRSCDQGQLAVQHTRFRTNKDFLQQWSPEFGTLSLWAWLVFF